MLPDSHTVKSVLTPGPRAVVPGGFSDVWKAENENREVFAIKVLRMYQDNAELVKRVRETSSINSPLLRVPRRCVEFRDTAKRLLSPNGWTTRTSCKLRAWPRDYLNVVWFPDGWNAEICWSI